MINELYPSLKGSLDLLFTEFRGNWTQELLFFTQRMWLWSDLAEVRRLRRTNFQEIAILCEFWLSITNMWDMWHGDQGPERNTEPQLSVYCLEFHCSSVKTLRSIWVTSKMSDAPGVSGASEPSVIFQINYLSTTAWLLGLPLEYLCYSQYIYVTTFRSFTNWNIWGYPSPDK